MMDLHSAPYDAIVIGGGAAGLMACASAVQAGKRLLLLEKNSKLGVKILMSGGTRCNITHACDPRGIVQAFGPSGRFLHSALAALGPTDVVRLIESAGVRTKVEPGGKVFPVSNRALDVRDAIVQLATNTSYGGTTEVRTSSPCRQITRTQSGFVVETDCQRFEGSALIVTTGGQSYPACGTTGDGYHWARQFGHRINTPVAALTPILNRNCWTNNLKGITLDDVDVRVRELNQSKSELTGRQNPRWLARYRGGFLFTHFGFSGPAVLNVSRAVSLSDGQPLVLQCDFEPDVNCEQFRVRLRRKLAASPKQMLVNVLSESYPRRLVESSLDQLQICHSTNSSEVSNRQLTRLTDFFKQSQFAITGTFGFQKAEVTAGGIHLGEIDSRTMQSKKCPGLFFAGEVLDLDGPIGGYNFQAAFSTGWLAGQHIS